VVGEVSVLLVINFDADRDALRGGSALALITTTLGSISVKSLSKLNGDV
jgi:hypothetical protein